MEIFHASRTICFTDKFGHDAASKYNRYRAEKENKVKYACSKEFIIVLFSVHVQWCDSSILFPRHVMMNSLRDARVTLHGHSRSRSALIPTYICSAIYK